MCTRFPGSLDRYVFFLVNRLVLEGISSSIEVFLRSLCICGLWFSAFVVFAFFFSFYFLWLIGSRYRAYLCATVSAAVVSTNSIFQGKWRFECFIFCGFLENGFLLGFRSAFYGIYFLHGKWKPWKTLTQNDGESFSLENAQQKRIPVSDFVFPWKVFVCKERKVRIFMVSDLVLFDLSVIRI